MVHGFARGILENMFAKKVCNSVYNLVFILENLGSNRDL